MGWPRRMRCARSSMFRMRSKVRSKVNSYLSNKSKDKGTPPRRSAPNPTGDALSFASFASATMSRRCRQTMMTSFRRVIPRQVLQGQGSHGIHIRHRSESSALEEPVFMRPRPICRARRSRVWAAAESDGRSLRTKHLREQVRPAAHRARPLKPNWADPSSLEGVSKRRVGLPTCVNCASFFSGISLGTGSLEAASPSDPYVAFRELAT